MAKRKNQFVEQEVKDDQNRLNQRNEKEEEQQQVQAGQMAAAEDVMQQIDDINNQTKILEQEQQNKEHDPEFSDYAEGTGGETLQTITDEDCEEAYQILQKYREKKQQIEKNISDNEKYWQLAHWEVVGAGRPDDHRIKPKTAHLVNTIINKHADAMDNYPEPNILPRERDDEETAKVLSEVVPVILEQCGYEQTYSDCQWYKAKQGTSVQGVFWNNDLDNGLGNVDIKPIDVLDVYWQPGITNIQDSPNVFHVSMMNTDEVKARFPEFDSVSANTLPFLPGSNAYYGEENMYEEQVAVIDWYYKRRVSEPDENGIPQFKTLVHYCKFCNGKLLYASENDPNYADTGWYEHGKYPFIFDTLYPVARSLVGFGYIDMEKDTQLYVDKLKQAILENAVACSRPRYAVNTQGGLNKEQFLDLSQPIVDFDGTLGENDFRQIVASPLSSIYETVYLQEVQDMKDTSGNTAATQGQASTVTSASGIASLQEAAGKLARDSNATSYRAYKEVVEMVIELIRQFYTEQRCFRITGDNGTNEFVSLDNSGLTPQPQGMAGGIDLGNRLPIMDVKVKAQKRSQYSKESQNQTATNLYSMGFFAPQNTDAALGCLDMMEFEGIEKVRDTIRQNGTLYDQLMQMQQQMAQMAAVIDQQNGTNLLGGMTGAAVPDASPEKKGSTGNDSKGSLTTQAAGATRQSTAVR